jgi:hypothetical protein
MFHSRPARKVRAYRPRLEVLESRTLLSTYLVDHLADDLVGTGTSGSLRYAITHAVDGDAITFGVTGTINLTGALPDLTHNISINGPGANLLAVRRDTGGYYGIFTVWATVGISGLTIANGYYDGGGILNEGSLTLSNCTVTQNSGNDDNVGGGGILNDEHSVLTVSNCTVTQNQSADGGGILNFGTATVNNSTITNNTGANGGGVANEGGTMTIANSTISGNTAYGPPPYDMGADARGGGIYNGYGQFSSGASNLVVTNSTITGNVVSGGFSSRGGGIASIPDSLGNPATLTINNCTISGNRADTFDNGSGGGIENQYAYSTLNMRNTIVAGNTVFYYSGYYDSDLHGTLTSSGYNLIGNTNGGSGFVATDLLNVNPKLGPLQNNGGPTQTMAPLAGSPALNAGDPAQLGAADQRGVVRRGSVNIGAYQASASAFLLTAPGTVQSGAPFDVTVTAVDVFGQPAYGYTGTVTFSTSDNDPGVVLPANYTFTASDQGTHTFSGGFTLITPGDQTITATDAAGGFSASATVTVQNSGAPVDDAIVGIATIAVECPAMALTGKTDGAYPLHSAHVRQR